MTNRITITGKQVIVDNRILEEEIRTIETKNSNALDVFVLFEGKEYTTFKIETQESLEILLDCSISEVLDIADRVYTSLSDFEEVVVEMIPDFRDTSLSFEIQNEFILNRMIPVPILYASEENGFRRAYKCLQEKADGLSMISLGTEFDYSSWKNPYYSPNEFREAFLTAYPNVSSDFFFAPYINDYYLRQDPFEDIGLAIKSTACQHSLRKILLELLRHMRISHELAVKNLLSQASTEALVEYFSFPEESKIACIQYLQYFYEFLKDIGVQAKVKLDVQDSGGTILSVIPEDKDEALENIRLALDIYLRLPSSQIEPDISSIQVQSLNAQIFHLKGQLTLAAATIQQQQSTIQNLQIQQQFSPNVLVLSQQGENKDQEPLLGGIIKVGEAELAEGALSINLAALLRWLKKKIGKSV